MSNLHQAGRFDAHILDHGYSTAKSGTLQLWVTFDTGRGTLTGYFPLTDKSAEHTVKKVRAMGYQLDDLDALADGTVMRGNWCCITVQHENYQGNTNAKIAFVDPYGSEASGNKRLDPAQLQAANAKRFNALLKHEAKVAPSKPPPAAHVPAPNTEYDELNPPPLDEPGMPF